ncbi:MAG: peptidylprolyl isomerase [Actinomycetota bacterium]|nr:peptidylprolyl isomerase [Actinomycetota bacterium]
MTKPRSISIALAAVLAALTLAACGGGSDNSSKDVPADAVAVVGDKEITKVQFDALIDQARASAKQQKRPFPKAGTPEFENLQNQGLDYLIRRAEFEQKADEMDVEVTDKQVDERLDQLKKQFYGGDDKKFKSSLKKLLLTEEQVKRDVRAQLLEEQLYKKVTEDIKVTDEEIQKFYDKNKAQYQQAATREVRHILVKKKPKADALFTQLKGGADFAKLAKKNSEDPGSKSQGGKLTVSKGQTVPPFDKAAFSLDKGELSKPIKTQYGWHIIEPLSEVKKASTTPLPQVKEAIKQQLLSEKKTKEMREWIDSLKEEFDVAYATGYEPPSTSTTQTTQTDAGDDG